MGSREDPLAFLPRLVAGYSRGWYTPAEVAGYCLAVSDERTAAEVVRALPPDLLEHLAGQVRQAPATEPEWAGLRLVNFGVVGGALEPDPNPGVRVARYRAAIEALRRALGYGENSQAEPGAAADPRRQSGPGGV